MNREAVSEADLGLAQKAGVLTQGCSDDEVKMPFTAESLTRSAASGEVDLAKSRFVSLG